MIDYSNDEATMVMHCDGYDCDKTLEMSGGFTECIQEAKDNEWKITKTDSGIDEEYEHHCPRCWANRGAKGVFE